jgi:hypothetical protein
MGNDTGSIYISSQPVGAKIELRSEDGTIEPVTETTPFTIKDKKPGKYTVTVIKDEYSASKEVKVDAGSVSTVKVTILTPEIKRRILSLGFYTSLYSLALIAIAITMRVGIIVPPDKFTLLLIYIACAGGLGGLAFNMYVLVNHVGREQDFRMEYTSSYILRPFIGILYGTFVFFFVAGGLMSLSNTSPPLQEGLFTAKAMMFYMALAFLAGFSEEPFSLKLKELAEAMFQKPPDENAPKKET